jgi:hypothetical protein
MKLFSSQTVLMDVVGVALMVLALRALGVPLMFAVPVAVVAGSTFRRTADATCLCVSNAPLNAGLAYAGRMGAAAQAQLKAAAPGNEQYTS